MSAHGLSDAVLAHLRYELSLPDPWRLESSDYERHRYDLMRRLLPASILESGLEVGCAAGAFTVHLVGHCRSLRIVDVLPEALERTRLRLGPLPNVMYSLDQISDSRGWGETYDLIVVAEVLYYVGSKAAVARAVAMLSALVRPNGSVIFSSATDAVSKRWGLPHGAETAMKEWSRWLHEVERVHCDGRLRDEHAIIVRYCK